MSQIDAQCGDDKIRWDYYNGEEVCSKFTFREWHLIASDIDTDEEWKNFLSEYKNFAECYILKTSADNSSIGFVYLYKESQLNKIVSIHGGGWGRSMSLSRLYFRGMILMIETLLAKGYKVRTCCNIDNNNAFCFLRGVGFVKYCTTNTRNYMWINEKRLKNSRIYKYLNRL